MYDGEWVHEVMEGKTKYTYRSGDTFEGTFKDSQYSYGTYTIKPKGENFKGSFKTVNQTKESGMIKKVKGYKDYNGY